MSALISFQQDTFLASEIVAVEYFPADDDNTDIKIDVTLRGYDRGDFTYTFEEDDDDYAAAPNLYLQLVEAWKKAIQ